MEYAQYKFTNPETGQLEMIDPERWGWGVLYRDDTELHQFDSEGRFHRFSEIDQERVKLFCLYRLDDMSKRIDMVIEDGMRFYHKYIGVHANYFPSFQDKVRVYSVGFTSKEGHHSNFFVLPDDRIVISHNRNVDLPQFALKMPPR